MNRREWIRLVGASALVLSCGDNLVGDDIAAAVLEPAPNGFIVAVWSRSGREATVAIARGMIVTTTKVTLVNGSGFIEVDDLDPDTTYDVTVLTDNGRLGPHHVRTAPHDNDSRATRIAIAADIDPSPEFDSDLAEHVVAAAPELLVTIGDFPYTDNGPPAQTLDEYRERHVETRVAPRVRRLLQAMPVRAIYDDHEFRNNWDTMRAAAEADRYAAAIATWDEFFPIRNPQGDVRYRSFKWGANVELFLLDCRRFRSANGAVDDATKTMLGATQRQWLFEALAGSVAPFKLVFTTVPFDFAPPDAWTGFLTERQMLFDAVVGIPGVLFVTADQHYFAAHRHAYGIREFQIGPLCRGLGEYGPNAPGVLFRAQRYNVGIVDIDADRLVFTGLGAGGDRFYEETLTIDDLTPRRG